MWVWKDARRNQNTKKTFRSEKGNVAKAMFIGEKERMMKTNPEEDAPFPDIFKMLLSPDGRINKEAILHLNLDHEALVPIFVDHLRALAMDPHIEGMDPHLELFSFYVPAHFGDTSAHGILNFLFCLPGAFPQMVFGDLLDWDADEGAWALFATCPKSDGGRDMLSALEGSPANADCRIILFRALSFLWAKGRLKRWKLVAAIKREFEKNLQHAHKTYYLEELALCLLEIGATKAAPMIEEAMNAELLDPGLFGQAELQALRESSWKSKRSDLEKALDEICSRSLEDRLHPWIWHEGEWRHEADLNGGH
jgi:hypothetical protein